MGTHRADLTQAQAKTATVSGSQAAQPPADSQRHSVRAENGYSLGVPPAGDGLRFRDDLLATTAGLATARRVAAIASSFAGQAARGRQDRRVAGGRGQHVGSRRFWGAQTGPNPTDRRKSGSKHHVLTDGNGIPMAVALTAANRHDVTQLLPLVDAVPPVAGKIGRPRHRFEQTLGDRAYDSEPHRRELRRRKTRPVLARRRTPNGSGLGVYRWVVERT